MQWRRPRSLSRWTWRASTTGFRPGGLRKAPGESISRDLPQRSLVHPMGVCSLEECTSGTAGLHQFQSSDERPGEYPPPASTGPDIGLCEPCGAGRSPAILSEADGRQVRQSATAADQAVLNCLESAVRWGREVDIAEACCTADSRLSQMVEERGGKSLRISFWNGCDLSTRKGAETALERLLAARPRLTVWSPPCGPDSPAQHANMQTSEQRRVLQVKRHRAHRIQRNCKWIIARMCEQAPECEHLVEQPGRCKSWKGEFEAIKDLWHVAKTNGCCWGLRHSTSHQLLLKLWHFVGTSYDLSQLIDRQCSNKCDSPHNHVHHPIVGREAALSARYPERLCDTIVRWLMEPRDLQKELQKIGDFAATNQDSTLLGIHSVRRLIRQKTSPSSLSSSSPEPADKMR